MNKKWGVLLVNLGTPTSPTPWGVMKFLRLFLSDRRVVELPAWLWRFILYGLVLPFRSFKVAKQYQLIWDKDGSPLRVFSQKLAYGLSQHLILEKGIDVSVFLSMTYGPPNLKDGIATIIEKNISDLIVIPLFPIYSPTTTAAVFDAIAREIRSRRSFPNLFFIREYALEECYLDALAESIREHWKYSSNHRLLFSFHGTPKRNLSLGDTYTFQCEMLVKRLCEKLNLPENSFEIAFQSRFGFLKWTTPSTSEILTTWARTGVKSVWVVSPSFAVDCLETLEELMVQARQIFLNAGGEHFHFIPSLNHSDRHIRALSTLIAKYF